MSFSDIDSFPLFLSAKIILVSLVLFILLGLPLAYLMSKDFRLKWLLEAAFSLPLIFPPIATGFLLLLLLGDNGWLGRFFAKAGIHFIFSFNGLCLAAFISGLPLLIKPLQAALEHFPQNIKDASYIAGKGEFKTLYAIILPSIKKVVLASLVIAVARALGEVGMSLMLGGNIVGRSDTLSLAIYNAVFDGEYDKAITLCSILIGLSLIFFALLYILEKKNNNMF